ncbi:MAG: phosphoribosylanthranilate isomerase, partial [Armatimonadetes bacterium]|nr:phosphoribosylanthranilate isomerase [Armatimonadota bacterium]
SGCTAAQLHGEEGEEYIESLAPCEVIKAIRVGASLDEKSTGRYKRARAILLDTYVAGQVGGTGRRFDPAVAARLVQEGWRVIVAGGLTPENVGDVVAAVRPYGVDVSTGVDAVPGRKDREKVAGFIAAVRAADGEGG